MFDQPDLSTIQGLRDRAILELLFSSGLRVSKLTRLDRDHINLKRREFTVRGKGQKDRPILLAKPRPTGCKNTWINAKTTPSPIHKIQRR